MTDYKKRRKIMVDTQIRPSDVTKFPIIDAFLSVPREKFMPDGTDRVKDMVKVRKLFQTEESMLANGRTE